MTMSADVKSHLVSRPRNTFTKSLHFLRLESAVETQEKGRA
jgi:hypothetical protein